MTDLVTKSSKVVFCDSLGVEHSTPEEALHASLKGALYKLFDGEISLTAGHHLTLDVVIDILISNRAAIVKLFQAAADCERSWHVPSIPGYTNEQLEAAQRQLTLGNE